MGNSGRGRVTQPAPLPNFFNAIAPIGSQWSQVYIVTNDDGTLANITNKTFELIVRDRNTGVTIFSVNNTVSTTAGTISVTSSAASLQVILTPTATSLLTEWGGNYGLWMDPSLNDATTLIAGIFYGRTVATP
jgi:hypothetical protein